MTATTPPPTSRNWWNTVKSLMGASKSASPLIQMANTLCGGNQEELANSINVFFQSVSAHLPPLTSTSQFFYAGSNIPDEYTISVDMLERQLMKLKVYKATGPDSIPAWLLRDFAPLVAPPLCAIFNSSIREGFVPSLWRTADVVPLPKKSPPSSINTDLRPISLTPVISKVLEHFVCKWIRQAVEDRFNPRQFGAIRGSSTTHALVELTHYIHAELDKPGHHVRALLLDYSKAFDMVNHHILLRKFQEIGTPDCLTRWCAAFLLERQQRVKMGQVVSALVTINGGTAQGTLLGPLAFIVYLSDFSSPNPIKDFIYVDDTSSCCSSKDPTSTIMQAGASNAEQWAATNDMCINTSKTKEMVFTLARGLMVPPLTIGGNTIEQVAAFKLLGVTVTSNLSWTPHIKTLLKKVNQRLFLLSRMKHAGLQARELLAIYVSFIRPVLEYANPVWFSSLPAYLLKDIESAQKRALRIAFGPQPYDALLRISGLPTLHERLRTLNHNFYTGMRSPNHRLHGLLPSTREQHYNLRSARNLPLVACRTEHFKHSFIPWAVREFD